MYKSARQSPPNVHAVAWVTGNSNPVLRAIRSNGRLLFVYPKALVGPGRRADGEQITGEHVDEVQNARLGVPYRPFPVISNRRSDLFGVHQEPLSVAT